MSTDEAPGGTLSPWMRGGGPMADVVLSSRVRLARNLRDTAFFPKLDDAAARRLVATVEGAMASWKDENGRPLEVVDLEQAPPLQRQVLVEKHLTSPAHIRRDHAALGLSANESVSVMINEEDHVRIQCLLAGLQLEPALRTALEVEAALGEHLSWASDPEWGHLTTCPTNVGTGLRASVMLHLPALAMSGQVQGMVMALSSNGMTARGLYGEGSQAIGNLFQVSNSRTLGLTEEEIVARMADAVRQLVESERSLRERLANRMGEALPDQVWRAYGILSNARRITSAEAMELLSTLRLGIEMHIVPQIDPSVFNELIVLTRPGFMQQLMGGEQGPQKRDVKRAAIIRQTLQRAQTASA